MKDSEYATRISAVSDWVESLRSELTRMIGGSRPTTLYHYTDNSGFRGLIKSGEIWATHASKLNDTTEYLHGIGVVASSVRAAKPSTSKPLANKILSEFRKVDTYIASYSAEHDLLSQWRGYSGGQVGYCLGLATSGMATLDDSLPLLEPVIYDEVVARSVIDKLIQRVDEYFETYDFAEAEAGFLLGWVGKTLANLACMVKHPKFSEEREFRHFYQPGGSAGSLELETYFRTGRFGRTPYVSIPFAEKGRLPLITVTVGPCRDANSEIDAINAILEEHQYSGIDVQASTIPLRL